MDSQDNDKVAFYINVFNRGQIMREEDIFAFLRQLNLPLSEEYTLPCDNLAIVKRVLRNLVAAYEHIDNSEKRMDIELLLGLLD